MGIGYGLAGSFFGTTFFYFGSGEPVRIHKDFYHHGLLYSRLYQPVSMAPTREYMLLVTTDPFKVENVLECWDTGWAGPMCCWGDK